jgi:hypothetical protein
MLQRKLNLIYLLQQKYPDMHVCGSIGLFLHGIDLGRDIGLSDIDLVKAHDNIDLNNSVEEHGSDGDDFDYAIDKDGIHYEIRIDPGQQFEKVIYQGRVFNVSKLSTIISYKQEYADKGYGKHFEDLEKINHLLIKK